MDLKSYVETERGAATTLAQRLGVTPVMVSQWGNDVKRVPADRCPDIERSSNFAVTCEELRPDLKWVRVEDAGWPTGKPLLDVANREVA